jgi:hypothetical protein
MYYYSYLFVFIRKKAPENEKDTNVLPQDERESLKPAGMFQKIRFFYPLYGYPDIVSGAGKNEHSCDHGQPKGGEYLPCSGSLS